MSRNLVVASEPAETRIDVRIAGVEVFNGAPARVSFTVEAGGMLALHGPAGAGKSRLIDLLSFEGRPARGAIEVLGADLARLSPEEKPAMRRRIGVMFQDERLLGDLSAADNVALAAMAADRRRKLFDAEIDEVLAWVGLAAKAVEPSWRLSVGERRRLCLARAMINRPDLLLADEPTAGLPEEAAHRVLRLIGEINRTGTTVIIATRDPGLATELGAKVVDLAGTAA